MDIINWVYLLKNKLVKKKVQDPTQDLVVLGNKVSYVKRGDKYQSYGITVKDFNSALLNGTDYIIVRAQGTPEENAQEFIEAYAKAVAADRNGENRFSLVLAPGHYKFQETFLHNEPYINIVSLTGEQDVIFDIELNGQDPFNEDNLPAYSYGLVIEADDLYSDSLQSGLPSFLSVNGSVTAPAHGFNSTGMYFKGDADGYPVFTNFVIPQNQTTTVTFTFIHDDNCSDQGVCVYLDGDTPNWNWGTDSTRIAAQYNCEDPYVYGTTISNSNGSILVPGNTYIAEFAYNPTAGYSRLITRDLGGALLDTVTINEVLGAGDYRIAFSADSDSGSGALLTSSVMDIAGNAHESTVSGIKTMYYESSNYDDWSGFTTSYNLPLNVISSVGGLVIKNCTAGPLSFGANVSGNSFSLYGTFENCTSYGAYSFGYEVGSVNAYFTNCIGYQRCFTSNDDLSGSFTNCQADHESFRSNNGDVYGVFTGCRANTDSFNAEKFNYGNFINCIGDNNCFKSYSGNLYATCTNCEAGDNSFRSDNGDIAAVFTSCRAQSGFYADGANGGVYNYCVLYADSFGGGTQNYCID